MPTSTHEFLVSLPVDDRQRAMAFYREAFGFEPIGAPAEDGVPEPLQFRLDERTVLALIPAGGLGWDLGGRRIAPSGVSECLLGVTLGTEPDVDRLVERIRHAGGEVIAEPERQDWGYTAVCADVDGHAWQLTAAPSAPS